MRVMIGPEFVEDRAMIFGTLNDQKIQEFIQTSD